MDIVFCIKFYTGRDRGWSAGTRWTLQNLYDYWEKDKDWYGCLRNDMFKLEIETGEGWEHVDVFNGRNSLRKYIEGMVENFPSKKSASKR